MCIETRAVYYQVGGSVRDELLGLKSKDIDYTVEAPSYGAMKLDLLCRDAEIFLEKPEYLTIRAKVESMGGACDFVLARKDRAYYDGRHPESVELGTILDDLARRDFTVNAIARSGDGTLIDPHGGLKDIKGKVIRCVGSAEQRFSEDGLRMLRAIRFSITKEMSLDHNITRCLGLRSFWEPRLNGVSVERMREELHKCFSFSTPRTLGVFDLYRSLRNHLFETTNLWLKPTLEGR